MKELEKLNLQQYPDDFFIFSKDFTPGPERMNRREATGLWDTFVRGHLGIEKFMYSMKHLGADDLIDAGMKAGISNMEEVVQNHLGHTSKFMTRRYTQKGLEQSRTIIKQIAPSF